MFKLETDPEFWTTVKLRLPGGDDAEFRAKFLLLTAAEWDEGLKAAMNGGKQQAEVAQAQMIERLMRDWADVVDPETGDQVPLKADRLTALLKHLWFLSPMIVAYVGEITGRGARKN